MRILLIQNFSYLYRRGGAHKANRILLEELAARGHVCHVVAPASTEPGAQRREDFLDALATQGLAPVVEHEALRFVDRGVEVHAIADDARGPVWRADGLRGYLARLTPELAPDWIIVVDDYAGLLVKCALELLPERVVYLAHTPVALPFGPASYVPQPEAAERLRRCAGILTVSDYMRSYLQRWGGLDATVLRLPVYGPGPFPRLGHFDRGLVTLVNPSAIKGLPIFLALARAFPDVGFGAVPTWGTTAAEQAQLGELANVHVLPAADDIDDIFAQTRVLLVPSLWGEAFGQIVVEAMLRGIPVLASNSGGLPEAKLGVDHVLPVRMIERYEPRFNESTGPVPIIEPQELGPWEHALRELLSSRDRYEHLARASRAAAHAFVAALGIAPVERYLAELPRIRAPAPAGPTAGPTAGATAGATAGPLPMAVPSSADRRALLALRLRKKQPPSGKAPVIPRRPAAEPVPLSFSQQRLWFLERLNPGQPNNHVAIHLTGPLDLAVIQRCLTEIVRRHEVLRTSFPELDGRPVQQLHPAAEVPLPRQVLLHLPKDEREEAARRATAAAIRAPLDLHRGPVLRTCVFQLGDDEHVLVIVLHHIVSDGWSAGILIHELAALYRAFAAGQPSPLPELDIQYADFAHWQWTQRRDGLREQLAYWHRKLAGMPVVSELLTDEPRPAIQTYRGAQRGLALSAELVSELRALGQREGATIFMTLLAGFQALLARTTGQLDLAVGTPIAGRTQLEIEPLLGSFVNMLVMRGELSGEPTFREFLRQVRQTVVEAFANQEVPFEMVVEALRPERDLSRNPLFQIAFVMQSATAADPELPGLRARPFELPRETVNFDLTLAVWELPDGLQLYFEYNADLFAPATIARMLEHLHHLLRAAVEAPDRAVLGLPWGGAEVVPGRNATAAAYPAERCLHQLFEEQVARAPEALALACGEARLSYRALDAAANRVAHGLRARGVGPDVLVGLFLERSVEMVVGLLGILKAGGAYVPLDPGYPPARLAYMLEDSGCRLVLSHHALLGRLEMGEGREVLALDGAGWLRESADLGTTAPAVPRLTSRHLAYVIYTSGSTGQPKGVMIEHRSVVNLFLAIHGMIGLSAEDRWLATTSMSFDIAALELYSSLLVGGAVVLATGAQVRDPAWLRAELAASGATVMQSTPALWSGLLEQPGWGPPAGFRMLCGGEALGPALHARLTDGAGRAWNVYGPTETTIWSSAAELRKGERITIGAGLANTQLHVLDGQRAPLPIGVVGELYIGGAGVARGYLDRPALTAERFVADPFSDDPEARLYRTGDLARWLPNGALEYVGRTDTQVKLRGYRIELGEIEAALAQAPGVRQAVVVVRTDGADQRLVAYVVPPGSSQGGPDEGEEPDRRVRVAGYRQHLRAQLPGYMVPELYVELEAMPLTGNGKVDRKALPAPADRDLDRAAYVAPRTEAEAQLVVLWQSVLQLERVGVEDNFFALGGHSLLATRLVSVMRTALDVEVPLRMLFERPTVAGVAEALQTRSTSGEAALPPIRRVARDRDDDRDDATLVAAVAGPHKAKKRLI